MSKKIYGVTVGTPISPNKINEVLNPVKSVNGKSPDENGNVSIQGLGTAASEVNNSTSLIKHSPENVLPYASVDVVGGKTRKCRSLLNIPDTTVNGTTNYYAVNLGDFELPSGTYTLSFKYTHAGAQGGQVSIREYGNPEAFVSSTEIVKESSGLSATKFTVADGKKGVRVYLYSNVTAEATETNLVATNFMLNEGSTALPYEPYFEGLHNTAVTGFESIGANLIPFPYRNTSKESAGVKFTVNPDNSITAIGTATGIAAFYLFTDIDFGAGGAYPSNEPVFKNGYTFKDFHYDGKGSGYIYITEGSTVNKTYYPMINKGSTALPYEPYRKSVLTMPEAVQALDGYGWGVSDTVYNYVDWENGKFVKKVGKVVYNGTERWYLDRYNSHGAYVYNTTLISTPLAISDKFTRSEGSWGEKGVGYFSPNGTHIYFNSDKATVEEWKAYLAENPVTVYYELAEPVITDISELLSPDNLIEVSEGGTVEVVTDDDYAESVPTSITYYYGGNDIVGGKEIIGNLKGVASRANTAMKDGNGNVIATYYAPAPIISQTDITAGATPLATGQSYHVYE